MEASNNEKITMQELIEKYAPIANCFEFTIPYSSYDDCSFDHPYGKTRLSDENARLALDLTEKEIINILENNYNKLSEQIKKQLPDFVVLFNTYTMK